MTSKHDPFRFLAFVRRSGDLAFASRIAQMLDRELRALPRASGAVPGGARRVLGSLVDQLGLGTA